MNNPCSGVSHVDTLTMETQTWSYHGSYDTVESDVRMLQQRGNESMLLFEKNESNRSWIYRSALGVSLATYKNKQ